MIVYSNRDFIIKKGSNNDYILIRKQLDTVSSKYDELMEKAKIQNNTRFENFFRRPIDNTQNSLG